MGSLVSLSRRFMPTNSSSENNGANPMNGDHFMQTNSRLNLINQLIHLNGASAATVTQQNAPTAYRRRRLGKKPKTNNGNLNDFANVTFASHFYMAGRKFKSMANQVQTFLFGDQLDLAFILAHKPAVVFPYETPTLDAPSHYLQSLVNIRRDTLRLVKCANNDSNANNNAGLGNANMYQLKFANAIALD